MSDYTKEAGEMNNRELLEWAQRQLMTVQDGVLKDEIELPINMGAVIVILRMVIENMGKEVTSD